MRSISPVAFLAIGAALVMSVALAADLPVKPKCNGGTMCRLSESGLSDAWIRKIIVWRNRAAYHRHHGSCACPYDQDKIGHRCGGRSAFSVPGGQEPYCYPIKVPDWEVDAYKRASISGHSGGQLGVTVTPA
jgi:hypothetical protein